ncbi:helix-turn-helix domain-containing protein [Brevundimonas naejangsanensis]|uniref:helix-turn-helix domain-containing protein n=1 Tax=Brevundimonas naejangsanensis TaxID=588932 RepID=UPI001B7FB4A1|nr:helix-turn-helix transcriptional regulator [Brevundimonas naejangsanensis]
MGYPVSGSIIASSHQKLPMPKPLHDLDYRTLIESLTLIRQGLGMTQAELAARLERPQSYVSKIERFERRMDVGEWRRMALALGQRPADVFSEADSLLTDMDILAETNPSPPREKSAPQKALTRTAHRQIGGKP